MPSQAAKSTSSKSSTKKAGTARKRRKATQASSASQLICPECGKTFTRPASLGAHRSRAHGVAGATTRRSASASSRKRATGRASRARTSGASVDRDALLSALFPQGIPARETVIREVNAWLEQAERLARLS